MKRNCAQPWPDSTTTITINLPEAGAVMVRVYNTLGQVVGTVLDGQLPPGTHKLHWNAGGLPNGLYLYTVSWNGHLSTGKMVLLK